jgi:hypothetical protein
LTVTPTLTEKVKRIQPKIVLPFQPRFPCPKSRRTAIAIAIIASLLTLAGPCGIAQDFLAHQPNPGHAAETVSEADLPDSPQPQAPDPGQNARAFLIPTGAAAGQSSAVASNGSIQGLVTNQDGAVYEGVHVSLVRPAAGSALAPPEKTATTDTDGHFLFLDVPPGPFLLTVSSEGFATQSVAGDLHAGDTFQAPAIVLPVSTATSEIRVTASRVEIGAEVLHEEEKQRVFGAIPNFYVVYSPDAPPLTARQKYHLAWRSTIDPVTILAAAGVAGIQQADNGLKGYGQGAQGYAKRFGANYADDFIGDMLGGAVLPSLFKQDPRYFYKGTGTIRSRTLYAIANSVICKGDNGHWQFNESGMLGSLAAGGISNLYYPASDRNGLAITAENTLYGIAGSAVGNLFQEFLVRKLTPGQRRKKASQP